MYEIKALLENQFPAQLLEIPQPPKQLRFVGALPSLDSTYLCVVGSRQYTNYGKEACESIISALAGTSIIIISGLALGIDAIAHKAALNAGLTTLAIPGSGLSSNVLYPRSNMSLAKKILNSGGTLLSEFNDDAKATPYTFPQRNRLMAGLARGILVIEAAERSGTLITARLATEYNKDVFTIPSPITSRTAVGPNRLLKLGAIPVTEADDILGHWGMVTKKGNSNSSAYNEKILSECSDEEKLILKLLNEPIDKDSLADMAKMSTSEMNVLLSIMEIKGLIKEVMGKIQSTIY